MTGGTWVAPLAGTLRFESSGSEALAPLPFDLAWSHLFAGWLFSFGSLPPLAIQRFASFLYGRIETAGTAKETDCLLLEQSGAFNQVWEAGANVGHVLL